MNPTIRKLNPVPGQWVLLRGPGPFLRCEISVGVVRRREGFKLRFHNDPFGFPINRIDNVLAIHETEDQARAAAAALRQAQNVYAVERTEAAARFWESAMAIGVTSPKNGMEDRGDYDRDRHRPSATPCDHVPSPARTSSPFAGLADLVNGTGSADAR